MYLKSLVLSQFRQFSYREFQFDSNFTYIQGDNASGKTTLLEGIRYLSTGKSFRTHRDRRVIQHDCSVFSVRAQLNDPERSISFSYNKPSGQSGTREVRIDDDPLDQLTELWSLMPTVIFTPSHLDILQRGPSQRRSFINQLLSFLDVQYVTAYKQYQRALDQRNALVKKPNPDPNLLTQYEQQLEKHGRYIIEQRQWLLNQLKSPLKSNVESILGSNHSVSMAYEPSCSDTEGLDDVFRDERKRAIDRGYTTVGPQRDDWSMLLGERDVSYASRGQRRALVYALKMAESNVIMDQTDQCPIHLFDDLQSELDQTRFDHCLELALSDDRQWILTGTNAINQLESLNESTCIQLST